MCSITLTLKLTACTRFVKRYSRNVHVHRLETWFLCFLPWSCDCKTYLTSNETEVQWKIIIIIIFNLRTATFKAYCAIWFRRSNFRHQASPRVSPRESTERRNVELWARNVRNIFLNADFHFTFWDFFTCRKATTWDRRRDEDFFALKIRLLRPGANPRTWVPRPAHYL